MGDTLRDKLCAVYKELSGVGLEVSLPEGSLKIDPQQLRQAFGLMLSMIDAQNEKTKATEEALKQELTEVRHSLATLQADFDSKFEKNKVISLSIPDKGGLALQEDEHDSIKSFRPDSDDDSDDVRRKEEELRAKKRQKHMHSEHRHKPGQKCCHNHNHNHLYMDTHQQHYGL